MNTIYFIVDIVLVTSFLLRKKTNNKLNFVVWLIFTIALLVPYHTFLFWIMSLIHLPINIISYTFITLILSLFLSFDNIRYKKYQLYEFKKDQLICIGILTVFCIYLAVSYFGIPLEIKFETTDPNVHYFAANQFANSDVDRKSVV